MQASKHPEYNEEKQRLENTQKAIGPLADKYLHHVDGGNGD